MTKIVIIREDDDPIAEARISVGSAREVDGFYIVFRGNPKKVVDLLETAARVAKQALPLKKYEDHRVIRS